MIQRLKNAVRLIEESRITGERNIKTKVTAWTVKSGKEKKMVRFDGKTNKWSCSCWWFANRTAPDKGKWGDCKHLIACKILEMVV